MARYAALSSSLLPLTPDDLYEFRFLTDAQISPDGVRVAYAVKTANAKRDGYQGAIWLVSSGGADTPKQITAGVAQDSATRWSPDGERLAFTSDRGDVPKGRKRPPRNIFVLDLAGGEARQLTRFGDDCSDLVWSPDGRSIAFVVRDPKDSAEDDDDGIRVYDRARYKSDEAGLLDSRRKHIWIVGADGSAPRRVTDGDWDDGQPEFSPDGREVAFVSNRTEQRALRRDAAHNRWRRELREPVLVARRRDDHRVRDRLRDRIVRPEHAHLGLPHNRRSGHQERSARRVGPHRRLVGDQ
jgi:dipeptidyl aminopeptidase/acylaminoacyl peptidase